MKILTGLILGCGLLCGLFSSCSQPAADNCITIRGKVQFPDNKYTMQIIERQGFDKKIIDSCRVKEDGTYEFRMKVGRPGQYVLNCQQWQTVSFWAEDEDLEINFRGMDTARIKIKNPPYVHINGGPLNEVMNLVNWNGYRGYQLMIAVSQNVYHIQGLDPKYRQEVSMDFYGMLGDESSARLAYIAEHYADRHSVLAVLGQLGGAEYAPLVERILARMQQKDPDYAPLKRFIADRAEAKALHERMAEGQPAPEFSLPIPDGSRNLGPQDFKGKFLVLDFWASWCGPCRGEIPVLKKAYEKYHDLGVEFLSVSIDKDEAAWRKALDEEQMPWHQVRAPKAGKDIMKQYQFSGIPFILLIDREGRMMAKQLRGERLLEKIETAVNGKKPVEVKSVAMPAMGM